MNFLQVIVNSLPQMAIYSLATIGIVLIFRTTGTTNFAQGLIATLGTFMTTQMALYAGLPLWLGLIIGMAVAFLMGIFMDVVLIRNARKINASGKQMITMGMLLILSYVIPVIFKNITSNGNLGNVFESGPLTFKLFGVTLTIARNYVYVIILAILLLAVVFICLKFTKWGLGVRATASNEVVSQMLGINTKVITAFSWAISGALATIAGVFQAGDGAQGKNYIQKLVEDDGVFALVGNLGTWNIVAAQDYIEESGVPSVYWGTGSSYQYFNPAEGNERYTFPVQPIYNTEGRIMYLRAMQLASLEGSGVTSVSKIGVIHSSSDDGASIKAGIEEQRNINIQTNPDQPEVIFAQINSTTATELASQVQLVKDCDVVIIAGNQTYFQAAYTAMQTADVRKPVITSYVNIAPATVPDEAVDANASDIYGGAWVIIDDSADERQKADLLRFIAICDWGVEKGIISRSTADSYLISAYAMSSFIALDVFMTGIDRLADKEITREAFLEAMESAPINVPISGGVNYANGQRIGLDGMSFVKYVRPTEAGAAASTGTFVNVVGMQSIDQILGELDDAE